MTIPRTILALSPHLDDAIFSAGGALAQAAQQAARVIIATLFTGNTVRPQGFALACQLDKGIAPETDYMALRREEDRRACAIIGAIAWHLPLLEAPHRGYGDARALFGAVLPSDDMASQLGRTLPWLIAHAAPDEIWAPRAIGNHVDHVILHRAVRALRGPARKIWWTDWPYADRPGSLDAETLDGDAPETRSVALSETERRRKADACAAYSSQLGFQFGDEAAMRSRLMRQDSECYRIGRDPDRDGNSAPGR